MLASAYRSGNLAARKLLPRLASICTSTSSSSADPTTLSERSQKFLGSRHVDWTHDLEIRTSEESLPIYRVLAADGSHIADPKYDTKIGDELSVKILRDMVTLSVMDKILYDSQRQGRISFYMTNIGEEACQVGSAAALDFEDTVFGQYREAGVLLFRGFSLQQAMDQCYGNVDDVSTGSKQMPVHYGSKEHNFVTISSPLSTQMPQSVGAAYSLKVRRTGTISVCYFGDGAASEGDAHAAFNFAATLRCPILFFCRNNGYAISTPVSEQYAGDGIAGHGHGYGMGAIRVDGNDVQAVFNAVTVARKWILDNQRPVMMEVMTYRGGHHSTSDDSTAYRSSDEIKFWEQHAHPIHIWRNHLVERRLVSDDEIKAMEKDARKAVLTAFAIAEKKKKPPVDHMFTDVYARSHSRLDSQRSELAEHMQQYGRHYPLENFAK